MKLRRYVSPPGVDGHFHVFHEFVCECFYFVCFFSLRVSFAASRRFCDEQVPHCPHSAPELGHVKDVTPL